MFYFKNKRKVYNRENHLPHSTHLEPIKNWWMSVKYCTKPETRIEGPYDEKYTFIKTIKYLNEWQKKVEKIILEEPDDRTIVWVWAYEGGKGKTQFCKYLIQKYKADCFNNCKTSDIAYALSEEPKICLFDFSRKIEGFVNYSALESVKNGLIFSGKYESRMRCFNSPHVVVFANFPPEEDCMSKDRWKIIDLN